MKISELIIQTSNLYQTETFYSSILEFKILSKNESYVSFIVGHSVLTFEKTDNEIKPKYHFAFNIPFNKMEEGLLWISEKISLIEINGDYIAHFENWKAKSIYFYDNNENILELITRNDLNNYSEHKFTNESIISINEVGIVTEKPMVLGNEIIKMTKSEFFAKGPKREDFVAVGNENGLFVISNSHRNWFPTSYKAEKQRTKVRIKVDDTDFDLEFN
ncbi:VOC family protein [Chryseobacterium sp. PBS4-4]|uniref:VOC family protein n=1 Tax=Chryseobacterium edaphi TaxID=2976532 RepID=A0ABT2W5T5_9FLAO|nr:VOC family protein [Chryseobacterium edaphi]MCU7616622.1 VOC family protein [Chryseobacterium edaphi]